MSKQVNGLEIDGITKGLNIESLAAFPASPVLGRTILYSVDGYTYTWNDTQWVKLGGGGAGAYYYIAPTKTVAIEDGAVMVLGPTLRIDGQITLDGMISDSAQE